MNYKVWLNYGGLEVQTHDSQWYSTSWSPKAWEASRRDNGVDSSPSPKIEEDWYPNLKTGRERILSYSDLFFQFRSSVVEWGPLTLGRAIYITRLINSNVNLIKKYPHRQTQNVAWPNICAPHGSIEVRNLTITIHH